MLDKLKSLYDVFRAGQAVADPLAWKKGQMTGGLIAGFLGACIATAKAFGYDIPLSDSDLLQIGGAVIAVFGLFNAGATVASTDKFGLPAKPIEYPAIDIDPPVGTGMPAQADVRPIPKAAPSPRAIPSWFDHPTDDDHSGS